MDETKEDPRPDEEGPDDPEVSQAGHPTQAQHHTTEEEAQGDDQ